VRADPRDQPSSPGWLSVPAGRRGAPRGWGYFGTPKTLKRRRGAGGGQHGAPHGPGKGLIYHCLLKDAVRERPEPGAQLLEQISA